MQVEAKRCQQEQTIHWPRILGLFVLMEHLHLLQVSGKYASVESVGAGAVSPRAGGRPVVVRLEVARVVVVRLEVVRVVVL